MASIRRVGKGRFEASIQIERRRQRRKMFGTREEAEAWIEERQREKRDRLVLGGVTPKTLGAVAAEYLAYKASKGKRTVDEDRALLEHQLMPFFGPNTLVSEITAERIAAYEQYRATAQHPRLGRPLVTSTINRHLSVLRCLLRRARKLKYLREVPGFEMGREPEGRLRYLEYEEAVRLLDACRESRNQLLWTIVNLALNTGMRRGEILGLEWERVDFARGVLLLEQTKNGRRREVPMNQAVYDVLTSLPGRAESGPVFRGKNGEAWGTIATSFANALRRAKITDFRFHDLRHTFASWLVMDGATLQEVKELLGHRTLTMTLRYAHLAPDRLRDAVSRLDKVFALKEEVVRVRQSAPSSTESLARREAENAGPRE
jgi:integrase